MAEISNLWPILTFMAVQLGATIWWAATTTQRMNSLEEKARAHENHGSDIAVIKTSLESLANRIGDLVDELRSRPGARARK